MGLFVTAAHLQAQTPVPSGAGGTGSSADLFGSIKAPAGVDKYNAQAPNGIGLMIFFSNVLKLNAIICGSWSLFNFAMAGLLKIQSADDASSTKKVTEKITSTFIGLAIIAGSYTLGGIVSLFLFGDATFILNPVLKGIT